MVNRGAKENKIAESIGLDDFLESNLNDFYGMFRIIMISLIFIYCLLSAGYLFTINQFEFNQMKVEELLFGGNAPRKASMAYDGTPRIINHNYLNIKE